MPLTAGARLGPYEIVSALGAGGIGEVHRARDTRLDRVVAIEALPERLPDDPEALARFCREGKAVGALSQPSIFPIHDFVKEDGVSYRVMELLLGEPRASPFRSDPWFGELLRRVGLPAPAGPS